MKVSYGVGIAARNYKPVYISEVISTLVTSLTAIAARTYNVTVSPYSVSIPVLHLTVISCQSVTSYVVHDSYG